MCVGFGCESWFQTINHYKYLGLQSTEKYIRLCTTNRSDNRQNNKLRSKIKNHLKFQQITMKESVGFWFHLATSLIKDTSL